MPKKWPQRLGVYLGTITRNISFKRGNGEVALVLDELAECVSGNEWVEKELEEK